MTYSARGGNTTESNFSGKNRRRINMNDSPPWRNLAHKASKLYSVGAGEEVCQKPLRKGKGNEIGVRVVDL